MKLPCPSNVTRVLETWLPSAQIDNYFQSKLTEEEYGKNDKKRIRERFSESSLSSRSSSDATVSVESTNEILLEPVVSMAIINEEYEFPEPPTKKKQLDSDNLFFSGKKL